MRRALISWATLVAGGFGALGCQGSPTNSFPSADALPSSADRVSSANRAKPVVPKPIPGGDYFPASFFHRDGIIHQFYPVPGFDGPWAEPNGMTDFNGFVAQIFQGGMAVDSAGQQYIVDIDNRVYVGEYIGVDGRHGFGAFCEI
jgi:hypothetical protein